MKLLSIVVPCYNSQAYMRHCVKTLLAGGDEVEIVIVDDGSTDDTADIADEMALAHPGVVRVIHQENGGHGDAVMTGLRHAAGQFFKVVDSDDWVDETAYRQVLDTLRAFVAESSPVDLLVCNFVYDKAGVKKKHVMRYAGVLPEGTLFGWGNVGHFRVGQYILMHSVIFRTQLLRDCGLQLPKHTFYVDNLYVYTPMKSVRYMYYLDVDFYHYYIGREDQSVQEATMIRRIDQQLLVNRMMFTALDLEEIRDPNQRAYLFHYLEIVTTVSSVLLLKAGSDEHMQLKQAFWEDIRTHDISLYNELRYGMFGRILNLSGSAGRAVSIAIYKVSQKVFGFN